MLYPRKNDPFLDKELFRNPGSEYRGTPFWAWNCELEEEELLRQLDVLKEMGLGGAHMHVRTGMATTYLSDEHMALIKACVEKCRNEKMLAWLYDEDRWPSGAAGGIVTKDLQYRARHLMMTVHPYGESESEKQITYSSGRSGRSNNGYLLGCYDVVLDENDCLQSAKLIAPEEEAEGRKWYAYVETDPSNPWYNNQTYVNTLDKKAIQRFIEVTYERYLETCGSDFGGVVPAIFTDEPQFSHKQTLGFAREERDVMLPWSDDVPETFREVYGEDIVAHLPELLWELPDNERSLIRYHYHDHIAERFAQAFADQCGKWCSEHNLMLTGHMMEEPWLSSQTASLGETMRSYRAFQLPGIDMLCAHFELTTAKQAQSAAHQYGRPGVLSELYGVTGWAFDMRGHKLHGDWQAALGVTVRVHHLSWVSMKGEAKRDYPASMNYQSPWWKDYRVVEDHFARVNTALTRGRPLVRVGVIHPVESYWLHWGPAEQTFGIRNQLDRQFRNLTDWLLKGTVDFDFISESLLPELCEKGAAPLKVGEMAYDVIIVPGCETLRGTTMERLEGFLADGGKLLFLGNAPELVDAIPSARGRVLWANARRCAFDREELMNALEDVRILDIRNENGSRTENLIHQLRQDGNSLWLFVAHAEEPVCKDVVKSQKIRITLQGTFAVELYDTQTGAICPVNAVVNGGKTVVNAELYDYDSLLLRLDGDCVQSRPKEKKAIKAVRRLPVPEMVDYRLDEPNAVLLDKAEFALDNGEYQPAQELLRADNVLRSQLGWPNRQGAVVQPWVVQEEKAEHEVRLRFRVYSEISVNGAKLALEDADAAKIVLNGQTVQARPDGWFVDKCLGTVALPALNPGENVLEVTLPFGRRTNVEWCYLLGDFGVEIAGGRRTIVPKAAKLGFDDISRQKLPHYTGNVAYQVPIVTEGGSLRVTVPHYNGAMVRVELDGKPVGYVIYPPYVLEIGHVEAGKHQLDFTLLNTRENAFGPLHRTEYSNTWIGPDAWRTEDSFWTESYRLTPAGIRNIPLVEELTEE
ncbi:MAG: glycosyl hydrolase [Eubacteriales bacterium]|nr:glycosyl hydrolase [Eubacteriales bacterium]